MNADNKKSFNADDEILIRHYWNYGLDRYHYYDSHSVEWLRNTANQLALVNSLGATISVALTAGLGLIMFLAPGAIFFMGAIATLFAAFLAHRGNEKYASEMKNRIQTLSDNYWAPGFNTLKYAEVTMRSNVKDGNKDHKIAEILAKGSLICIIVGALFMVAILVYGMK